MYVHFSVTTDEGDTNQPSLYTLDLDYLPEGTIYFDDDGYEPEFVIKGTGENLDTLNLNDSGSYPYHILQLQKGNCNEGEPQIQWTSQESPPQDIWNIELHIQSPQRFEMIFPIQGNLSVQPTDNWHLCLLENNGEGTSELSSLYLSTLYPHIQTVMPQTVDAGDSFMFRTENAFDYDVDNLFLCPNSDQGREVAQNTPDPFGHSSWSSSTPICYKANQNLTKLASNFTP